MITFQEMYIGQIDAKNEVFQQGKADIDIFNTAFVIPPSIELDSLINGAKYFIVGPKGSGKTALLRYAKHILDKEGASTHVVLFKSGITEIERQRITKLSDVSIMTDIFKIEDLYDYKQNWLWYIYKEIVSLVDDSAIISGKDTVNDIRKIMGTKELKKPSIFDGIQLTKIKSSIRAAINSGPLTTTIESEFNHIKEDIKKENIFELINIIESHLADVSFLPGTRVCLFFDELELFVSSLDQRDRDLRLIRDLLYAVNRANHQLSAKSDNFTVFASVRTEVLSEINRIAPESKRDVSDFSIEISWDTKAEPAQHPLLQIFERKIQESENTAGQTKTSDVWSTYFPEKYKGRDFRKFLLDISMLKPRNIVRLLSIIRKHNLHETSAINCNIDDYMTTFSSEVWEEAEEEILTSNDKTLSYAIKSILTRIDQSFSFEYFRHRVTQKITSDSLIRNAIGKMHDARELIYLLYRLGLIGNATREGGRNQREKKLDRWIFRGYTDPDFEQNFVVHTSIRKIMQI